MTDPVALDSRPGGARDTVAVRLGAERLIIDVDGFEGPLDLLLTLARTQKVDVARISVLALAEQYLVFIEQAQSLRLELAADYLVMAAWMAFLKSRLLLPPDPADEGPSGEELAAHLAFQLERLEAMRRAAAQLMARDRLGRDVFARGEPEPMGLRRTITYDATLIDLLHGYARMRTRDDFEPLAFKREAIYTMEQALERLQALMGTTVGWRELGTYLPEGWGEDPARRRSATASTFAAALELAKLGHVEIRQDGMFEPIRIRQKDD